jgi:hypothetical protein
VVMFTNEEQNGDAHRRVTLAAVLVEKVACGFATSEKAASDDDDDQEPTPLINGCWFCAVS